MLLVLATIMRLCVLTTCRSSSIRKRTLTPRTHYSNDIEEAYPEIYARIFLLRSFTNISLNVLLDSSYDTPLFKCVFLSAYKGL